MLGSQILNIAQTFSGRDFGANEFEALGYCIFERAISTADTWAAHAGGEIVVLLQGEACWDCGSDLMLQASGGQVVFLPRRPQAPDFRRHLFALPDAVVRVQPAGRDARKQALRPRRGEPVRCVHARGSGHPFDVAAVPVHRQRFRAQSPGSGRDIRVSAGDVRDQIEAVCPTGGVLAHLRTNRASPVAEPDRAAGGGHPQGTCCRKRQHQRYRCSAWVFAGVPAFPFSYRSWHVAKRLPSSDAPQDLLQQAEGSRSRSITDISYELGFSSSQHLSKVFKDYFGVSPSVYRTRHAELALGEP